MKHRENILKLREDGKSYNEIAKILNCSKSTVCYHCGEGQKDKKRNQINKIQWKRQLIKKIDQFLRMPNNGNTSISTKKTVKTKIMRKIRSYLREKINGKDGYKNKYKLSLKEVLNKIGNSPKCYLTGKPIDLMKTSTYQLDHIIPKSQGGENSLENLGLCDRDINHAKYDKTPEEFMEICKSVLQYNGYTVIKNK